MNAGTQHYNEGVYRRTHKLWFDDPQDSDSLRVIDQRKDALRSRKLHFHIGAWMVTKSAYAHWQAQLAGSWTKPCPPHRRGAVLLSQLGVSPLFELDKERIHTYGWPACCFIHQLLHLDVPEQVTTLCTSMGSV